jgi:hypothetical protein
LNGRAREIVLACSSFRNAQSFLLVAHVVRFPAAFAAKTQPACWFA